MKKMTFHFLNVGHGDCTFVELPSGRLMLVDINNSKSLSDKEKAALAASLGITTYEFSRPGSFVLGKSWEDYYEDLLVDPYDYYVANFNGQSIFRYIQTHPDMDHMSGLHRFFWQEKVPLWNFWDVNHAKQKNESDFDGSRHSYVDWAVYELLRNGVGPDNGTHKVMNNLRFQQASYWKEDGIHVLSPAQHLIDESDAAGEWNNVSYVLRFEFGGRSIILAGDAVQNAWQSMVDNVHSNMLDCDVLKAAHHGRKSGYHTDAVAAMDPHVVICSVGKKPETDAHQDYKNQGAEVFSTRSKGSMIVTIWEDGEVWVKDAGGEDLASLPVLNKGYSYA